MENGLGQDFSRVRVFTDAAADCAATRLGALAFTRGERIAFGAGQFAPGSREGRRLIGHELAHVAQQVRSGTKSLQRKADPDPAASGGKPDWDEAFRLADESRWEQVAELLTRFSAENLRYFIQTFKGQPEKISWLHRGALGNPKVGPDSPVARATLTVYLDVSFNEQAARSDWKRAAFFLNAFNATDMRARLDKLGTEKLKALHEGAVTNDELGVDCTAARISAEMLARRSAQGDAKALLLPTVRGEGKDALVKVMRVVDDIRPSPEDANAFTMVVDGQPQKLSAQQVLDIRQRFAATLRDHLARVDSKASTALSRYISQNEIDRQHWIVAPIVKTLGGVKDPGPVLVDYAHRALDAVQAARGAVDAQHFAAAAELMANAERSAISASKLWQAYFEGVIGAAEMTVTVLEITRDASFITLAILATIATGGAAAGALGAAEGTTAFGVTLGVSQAAAANAIAVGAPIVANLGEAGLKVSMGDKVDWGMLVVDTAIQIIIARFGGRLTGGIARAMLGNPATERLAAQVTEKIVHAAILHAESIVLTTAAQDAYQALRGKNVTWQAFVDQIIERLTDPKGLAVLAVTSAVGSAAQVRYGNAAPGQGATPRIEGGGEARTPAPLATGAPRPQLNLPSKPAETVAQKPITTASASAPSTPARPLRGASAGGAGKDFNLDVWEKPMPPVDRGPSRDPFAGSPPRAKPQPPRQEPLAPRVRSSRKDIGDVIREETRGTASLADEPVERTLADTSDKAALGEELGTRVEGNEPGAVTQEPLPRRLNLRRPWTAPAGSPPKPPLDSPMAVRVAWLRQRLQLHVEQARQRYAIEGMTANQESAAQKYPRMERTFRGSRIDQFAKDTIMEDPELAEIITAPDFISEPDLIDSVQPTWFDITTRASWRAHVTKYARRYGAGHGYLLPTTSSP